MSHHVHVLLLRGKDTTFVIKRQKNQPLDFSQRINKI